jgi:hypothetical protein
MQTSPRRTTKKVEGVYRGLTMLASNSAIRTFRPPQHLRFSLLPPQDKWRRVMDALLLVFAWAAGLMSLFLVADMIAADFIDRRAERVAEHQLEPALVRRRRPGDMR